MIARRLPISLPCLLLASLPLGCSKGPGQLSTNLSPQKTPDYYVAQAQKYFDTFDNSADPASEPTYSLLVARWEWPPWLKLTGYKHDDIISADKTALKATPSTVPKRECRAFAAQPFARCYISFQYAPGGTYPGGLCPIYEEFTFNDQGEMTFIEAWSDLPGDRPMKDPADRWAEGPGVHRLSTRIPGLGDPMGLIDLQAPWMTQAATKDPEVADFVPRANDFWTYWLDEYAMHGKGLFQRGCGWQ